MALPPQTASVESIVNAAEAVIDNHIINSRQREVYVSIASLPASLGMRERQILTARYLGAGWGKVEFVSDQRNGDYVVLKEKGRR